MEASALTMDPLSFNQRSVVLICHQIEASHPDLYAKIVKSEASIISFLAHADQDNQRVFCLNQSFSINELKSVLSKCHALDAELEFNHNNPVFERLLGKSKAISRVKSMIHQVAQSDATVLLLGQSGTGKDVVASCIHYLSMRQNKAYVPINCAAIPSELIESELFGHEKGAFTGAHSKRQGRFELAQHGTLFLDEIGDMPLAMQVKLLRVLQERKFERVGGNTNIETDARIIAATNKNLEELIQKSLFREDLYHRINVFPIHMPSLCDRADDIPDLINYHLTRIQKRTNHIVQFTDSAIDTLCHYQWPGNIRELENFLERMVILHHERVLDISDLEERYKQMHELQPHPIPQDVKSFNIQEYIAKVERETIEFALKKSDGIVQLAANYLSIGTQKLTDKMKEYNLILEK